MSSIELFTDYLKSKLSSDDHAYKYAIAIVENTLARDPRQNARKWSVIKNTTFVQDPYQYVINWGLARGMTEEYRIPEDDVLSIFMNYYGITHHMILELIAKNNHIIPDSIPE